MNADEIHILVMSVGALQPIEQIRWPKTHGTNSISNPVLFRSNDATKRRANKAATRLVALGLG